MRRDPLLIVGISPRSGTNLLFYHLASSPSCIFPKTMFECNVFHDAAQSDHDIHKLLEQQCWDPYRTQHLLLKTPISENCHRLIDIYPNAKMVVIVRNGKRIVDSMFNSCKSMENGLEPHMIFYKLCAEHLIRLLERLPSIKIVKYEDLVSRPIDTIIEVCNTLGLVVPPVSKITQVDQTLYGPSLVSTHNDWRWEQIPKPTEFDPNVVSWSDATHRMFDQMCGYINERFGY